MRGSKTRVFIKRKKRKENDKFWKGIKMFVIFILISYVAFVYLNGYYKSYQKRKEVYIQEQSLNNLKKENEQLRLMIKRLKTDEEIERLAREIGLVKPNETSIRIIYPKEVTENSYKNITKKNKTD